MNVELDILPVFQVNYFGAIRVTNSLFPFILESKGAIVNVVSVAGRIASIPIYSDSKFGKLFIKFQLLFDVYMIQL